MATISYSFMLPTLVAESIFITPPTKYAEPTKCEFSIP